jgi:hypothetical protein
MVAYLKHWNGTPTVFFEGKPVFPGISCGWGPSMEGWKNDAKARVLAPVGVNLYSFDMGAGGLDHEWCGPGPGHEGDFDFSTLKVRYGRVIDADPNARFYLRFHLEIYLKWWLDRYPEEREIDSDGNMQQQSFASLIWREQAKDLLRQYVLHLRELGLEDRVFAWQVGAGHTGEWVKGMTSMRWQCGDYSAPMRRRWREWLRQTYGDVGALQEAWGDKTVTFDNAEVPTAAENLVAQHQSFRDPRRERKVIDYYTQLADLCGGLIVDYCRTIKETARGTTLCGAFYGYLMELAWNAGFFAEGPDSLYSTTQRSGHLGLWKTLQSPYVDFYSSPFAYGFRGLGGYTPAMQPTESLRLHGKIYFFEDDIRTHLDTPNVGFGVVESYDDCVATLRRNFVDVITRGHGIWWAVGDTNVNPIREPRFVPILKRFMELGTWATNLDRQPSADIAVMLDDESFFYESIDNQLDIPLIWQQKLWGMPRIGAPHDIYLLNDLVEGHMKDYKVYIFLNAFHLDAKRRAMLAEELRRDGKVAVWIYAPGYLKDEPGLEHMTDLTGIKFDKGEHAWGPLCHIMDFQHPITQGLRQDLFWGTNARLGPVFHVEDAEARTLGQVVYSQGRCKPGFVLKEFGDWSSIYIAAPNIPAPVLRGIARWAGVHLYNEQGDVLYATPQLLGVHTTSGGAREFALPRTAEVVYDLFENKVLAENVDRFSVNLPKLSTQLYFAGERRLLALLPERSDLT